MVYVKQLTLHAGVESDVDPLKLCRYFKATSQQGQSLEPGTDVYDGRLHIDEITHEGKVLVDFSENRKQTITESTKLVDDAKAILDSNPKQAVSILNRAVRIWSRNARAYKHLGRAYGNNGDLLDARVSFERSIKRNPSDAEAHAGFGTVNFFLGNKQAAVGALREAVAINPRLVKAWNNLGAAYLDLGKYAEAMEACIQAHHIDPDDAMVLANMGGAHIGLEEYVKGKESCERAIVIDPKHVLALANLGAALLELEEYEDAKIACQKAVTINPNNPNHWLALFHLGRAHLELKEYAVAKAVFQSALAVEPREVAIMAKLAFVYMKLEEYGEARDICLRALGIQPKYIPVLANLGDAYTGLEEPQKAKETYQRALRVKKDDIHALKGLGTAHLHFGEYEDGKKVCQKVIKIKPRDVAAWTNLGVAHIGLGELRAAKAVFQRALEIEPKNDVVWANLGNVYIGLEQYEDAMHALRQAIAFNPQYESAHLTLGQLYQLLGGTENYEKARDVYEKLTKFWPAATAYYNLGEMYLQLKEYEKARNAHREVAKIEEEIEKRSKNKPPDEYNYLRVGILSLAINDLDEAKRYLKKAKPMFHDADEIKTCSAFLHWANAKRHWDNKRWSAASNSFQRALAIFNELPDNEFATAIRAYEQFIDIEHNLADAIQQESIEHIYKHVRRATRSAEDTIVSVDAKHVQLLAAKVHCLEAIEEILLQAKKILRKEHIDLEHIDKLLEAAEAAFEGQDFKPGLDAINRLINLKESIRDLNTETKIHFEVLARQTLKPLITIISLSATAAGYPVIGTVISISVSGFVLSEFLTRWQRQREDEVIRIIEGFDKDKDAALRELSHPRYASALKRISDPHSKTVLSSILRLKAKKYLEKLQK